METLRNSIAVLLIVLCGMVPASAGRGIDHIAGKSAPFKSLPHFLMPDLFTPAYQPPPRVFIAGGAYEMGIIMTACPTRSHSIRST